MDAKKTKTVISEEAKLRAKNYMRLKDGYVEPKQEPCDNCNNDVCCCIIRTQETLEEALSEHIKDIKYPTLIQCAEFGAKWQQTQDKNKYSDEEVLNLLIECSKWQLPQTDEDLAKIKQWFAEFKKK
jgi:hypothetical protein